MVNVNGPSLSSERIETTKSKFYKSVDPLVNRESGVHFQVQYPASLAKLTYPDVKNSRVTCCEMQFPRIHGASISYTATRLSNYYARNVQPSNRIRRIRLASRLCPPRNPPQPSYAAITR